MDEQYECRKEKGSQSKFKMIFADVRKLKVTLQAVLIVKSTSTTPKRNLSMAIALQLLKRAGTAWS